MVNEPEAASAPTPEKQKRDEAIIALKTNIFFILI
jgi:hypothetical protein